MFTLNDIKNQLSKRLYLEFSNDNIFWRILDVDLDKEAILVIAKETICKTKFDKANCGDKSTWDNSLLRSWLNDEYYNNQFSSFEKDLILETKCLAEDNLNVKGGKDTLDYIFLLSINEISKYLGSDLDLYCNNSFWLRSPGRVPYNFTGYASCVSMTSNGCDISKNGELVSYDLGVRPAMWIKYDPGFNIKSFDEITNSDCLIIENDKLVGLKTVLNNMDLPEGIKEIPEDFFYGELRIKSLKLPSTLERIGKSAFEKSGIVSIVIPEGVTKIEDSTFKSSNLKTISLPNSVSKIKRDAFSMSKLEEINFPDSLDFIGSHAFYATKIEKVSFNKPVLLKERAFWSCENLKDLQLAEGTKLIEEGIFTGCKNLKYTLSKSVKSLDKSVFELISLLTIEDGFFPELVCKYSYNLNKEIPFRNTTLKITNNEEYALIKCKYDGGETSAFKTTLFSSFDSKDGCFTFDKYDACFDLAKKPYTKAIIATLRYLYPYKLADDLKTKFEKWINKNIEKACRLFIDNYDLEIIDILYQRQILKDDVVKTLIAYAKSIGNDHAVKKITEMSKSEVLNNEVIEKTYLKKWINNHIESVKDKAAKDEDFVIENGILKQYVGKAKVAIVPKNVKEIADTAFKGNEKITEIILLDGVETLNYQAFYDCSKLEMLIIPDSVAEIKSFSKYSSDVLKNCTNLKTLIVPKIFVEKIANEIEHAFNMSSRYYFGCNFEMLVLPEANYKNFDNYYKDVPKVLKAASALGFLLDPKMYESNIDYEAYKKYALAQRKNLLSKIFEYDLVEALYFYNDQKKITAKNIDEYLNALPKSALKCAKYLKEWTSDNKKDIVSENKKANLGNEDILKLLGVKSTREIEEKISNLFSLKLKELPEVLDKEGKVASPYLLASLLYKDYQYAYFRDHGYVFSWFTTDGEILKENVLGNSETTNKILAILDNASLQKAFLDLIYSLEKYTKKTKKHDILYMISKYSDEEGIKNIIAMLETLNLSKDYVYDYLCFNSTNTVIEYADKCDFVKAYALLRQMEEDEFRDKYIYETGLDINGNISFDLKDKMVFVHLAADFSLSLKDSTGKELKTFPRTSKDKDNYNLTKNEYDNFKFRIKSILKSLKSKRMADYLKGKEITCKDFKEFYFKEYLHLEFAKKLLWCQEDVTFVIEGDGFKDVLGNEYKLDDLKHIKLAHNIDLKPEDIEIWRKYFIDNKIVQPFEQVFELAIDFEKVKEDRYSGISLNQYYLLNREKDGINYQNGEFNYIENLDIKDECLEISVTYDEEKDHHLIFKNLKLNKKNRMSNHIIYLLDKLTVYGRIEKDDLEVMKLMDNYNVSQIINFIEIANKNNANNVSAALIDYKNRQYPDFDVFDEFVLED